MSRPRWGRLFRVLGVDKLRVGRQSGRTPTLRRLYRMVGKSPEIGC